MPMNPLVIKLSGEIENSNFDEWKNDLVEQIRSVNTTLTTEDQFAEATKNVKQFKAAEKSLKQAKQSAIEQAAEINKLFEAIDTVSEETRQVRLSLEKQIKKRKAEIKQDHITSGMETIQEFISGQSKDFKLISHNEFLDEEIFEDTVKGRTSAATMQVAIDKVCIKIQESIVARAAIVTNNAKIIDSLPAPHKALLQDRAALLALTADELNSEIDKRVTHWEEQQGKATEQPVEVEEQTASKEEATEPDSSDEDKKQAYHVTLELHSTKAAAEALLQEVEKVWGGDSSVKKVQLIKP